MLASPNAGGCTFAENPGRSFAEVRILWTSKVDPSVLEVVAEPIPDRTAGFDFGRLGDRISFATDALGEHVAIRAPGRTLRLDVKEGTLFQGPVLLRYLLSGLSSLPPKLDTLHALLRLIGIPDATRRSLEPDRRLPRLVEALRVLDALADGASLRAIGGALLGEQAVTGWPGDGEHLKSWVRRRVILARRLENVGSAAILGGVV